MKWILKHIVFETYALYIASTIATGMVFENNFVTLIYAGAALAIGSIFAKPVINLLLLPLNLVTFGLFRWVAFGVILFLTTLVVKSFKVTGFYFQCYHTKWLDLPTLNFKGIIAFIAFSFIISLIISFIDWLTK